MQEPFDQIYDQTYPMISKYVVLHCENIDDVKDILQDIYFDVYKLIKKNKNINSEYIMGITKNKRKNGNFFEVTISFNV